MLSAFKEQRKALLAMQFERDHFLNNHSSHNSGSNICSHVSLVVKTGGVRGLLDVDVLKNNNLSGVEITM